MGSNPAEAAHGLLVQRITVYQTLNLRDQGSTPVGVAIMDSWLKGRGARLKLGKRLVRLLHCPLMCARSGTSLDCKSLRGWFESICALSSRSSKRRGQGIPNPQIWVQIPYGKSGYVAKRLCSGLLTRQTQVRPLSCPLRSDDVTESILACQA